MSGKSQPIGKKELLKWAGNTADCKCNKLDDLKSGVVILKIFSEIWPLIVEKKKIRQRPRSEAEVLANWNTIQQAMVELQLPMEVFDPRAIPTGQFRQAYPFLVMLYFLQNLSKNHEFSVDFAYPIDGKLAAFLQSTASVECLAKGGGLKLEDIPGAMSTATGDDLTTPRSDRGYPDDRSSGGMRRQSSTGNLSQLSDTSYMESLLAPSGGDLDRASFGSIAQDSSTQSVQPSTGREWEDEMYKTDDFSLTGKLTSSTQTVLTSRKLQKVFIKSMKMKRELTEVYQQLEQSDQSKLSDPRQSITSALEIDSRKVDIVWKNQRKKLRGEFFLTKMRYEIESLKRRIIFLEQQNEYADKKWQHKFDEMKAAHAHELKYLQNSHSQTATTEQIMLVNERQKDRHEFNLELAKIRQEIAYESDRIRQGGFQAEDDDAIEDEILRLRQLSITQSKQIEAAEESNNSLRQLIEKLQETLASEHKKIQSLHQHYVLQDEHLLGNIKKRLSMPATDNTESLTRSERLLALELTRSEKENGATKARLEAEIEDLGHKLSQAHMMIPREEKEKEKEDEYTNPLVIAFDAEQKVDRLESEIDRLRRVNHFLRERSVVFDKLNEESVKKHAEITQNSPLDADEKSNIDITENGDIVDNNDKMYMSMEQRVQQSKEDDANSIIPIKDVWVPMPYVGEVPEEIDDANALFLSTYKAIERALEEDTKSMLEPLRNLFWKTNSYQVIFIQRIKRARNLIYNFVGKYRKSMEDLSKQRSEFESLCERLQVENRITSDQLKHKFMKEHASLLVKLQLTEDQLKASRSDINEFPNRLNNLLNNTILDDERRFTTLKTKLREAQEHNAAYRLRESLWSQLIETQGKNIDIIEQLSKTEDYEDAVALNKQREELELEAASCLEQLQALTQKHHQGIRIQKGSNGVDRLAQEREMDSIIAESTQILKSQLETITNKYEEAIKTREIDRDRCLKLEAQLKESEFALSKEQQSCRVITEQYHQMLESKKQSVSEMNQLKMVESEQIRHFQTEIEKLKDQLKEFKENPDAFQQIVVPKAAVKVPFVSQSAKKIKPQVATSRLSTGSMFSSRTSMGGFPFFTPQSINEAGGGLPSDVNTKDILFTPNSTRGSMSNDFNPRNSTGSVTSQTQGDFMLDTSMDSQTDDMPSHRRNSQS